MQVTVTGAGDLQDPRTRVLAIEAAIKALTAQAGTDAADGIMVLLTAAVHLSQQANRPGANIEESIAYSLGCAIVASEDFFKLREA